eukprot:COSAG02_NODE_2286_length_9213_cov_149.155914_9_plen_149_part_00
MEKAVAAAGESEGSAVISRTAAEESKTAAKAAAEALEEWQRRPSLENATKVVATGPRRSGCLPRSGGSAFTKAKLTSAANSLDAATVMATLSDEYLRKIRAKHPEIAFGHGGKTGYIAVDLGLHKMFSDTYIVKFRVNEPLGSCRCFG